MRKRTGREKTFCKFSCLFKLTRLLQDRKFCSYSCNLVWIVLTWMGLPFTDKCEKAEWIVYISILKACLLVATREPPVPDEHGLEWERCLGQQPPSCVISHPAAWVMEEDHPLPSSKALIPPANTLLCPRLQVHVVFAVSLQAECWSSMSAWCWQRWGMNTAFGHDLGCTVSRLQVVNE